MGWSEQARSRMREKRMGEANPNWKGRDVSATTARERARRILRAAICEQCGGDATDVHHRDGDPWNNDVSNLASLCRRCHMEVDGRMDELRRHHATRMEKSGQATHCPAGHELTEQNTKIIPGRPRACRLCLSDYQYAWKNKIPLEQVRAMRASGELPRGRWQSRNLL